MRSGAQSGKPGLKVFKAVGPELISDIKNENIQHLVELFNRKYKTLDVIHKISYYLEEVLEF